MCIRTLLCHAISEEAKRFYLHHGFVVSPIEPLTVMLNLAKGADGRLTRISTSIVSKRSDDLHRMTGRDSF